MKNAPTKTRNGRTSRFAALALAGMLGMSSLAMADSDWIPTNEVVPATPSTPLAPAAQTVTPADSGTAQPAPAPAADDIDAALAALAPPPARTVEEMEADADRQILQSAWIHLEFIKTRLAAAKSNSQAYGAEYEAAKTAMEPYKNDVAEKTAAVNAMREEVEAAMGSISEKYDEKLSVKTEEEFDLQARLGEVGPLEYLPEREADRQSRIAAIKVQQAAVRDDIHVIEDQKQQEISVVRAGLDKARAELRTAEDAYAANYHRESTARYKVYQANADLKRFEAALAPAQERLETAKKAYSKHGDPNAVIGATQMPTVSNANNNLDDNSSIAMLEEMVANAEYRREEQLTSGEGEVDWTGMDPTGKHGTKTFGLFQTKRGSGDAAQAATTDGESQTQQSEDSRDPMELEGGAVVAKSLIVAIPVIAILILAF